jgi:murein DD-endopeptidase MepM/ murein hydrolase activator NlpD
MTVRDIDLLNEPFLNNGRLDAQKGRRWKLFVKQITRVLGEGVGTVFFVPHFYAAPLLWLILVHDYRLLVFALAGLGIAHGVSMMLRYSENTRQRAIANANAILASVAVAWLTSEAALSRPAQALLLVFTSFITAIVAVSAFRALQTTRLPSLALGYCLTIGIAFTLYPEWVRTAAEATPAFVDLNGVENVALAFLQSMGAIVYSPLPLVGLIVVGVLFLWSRTMLITGVVGWFAGVATAIALENSGVEYLYMTSAHNYFIAGMVLGSVRFLPGRWSIPCAIVAGAIAAMIAAAFQFLLGGSGFSFLPLPSIMTIWLGIGALAVAVEKKSITINDDLALAPEEAWWRADYWSKRAGHPDPYVGVPVTGYVEIVQGFDGRFSHKGLWRHAFDFQRPDVDVDVDSYMQMTWGTPVFAPMAGIVELASDKTTDNQIGVCNYADNWGNYIIIRMDRGGWLLLGHFRQGTMAVRPGSRVVEGDYLGEIGNSGRSPYPHLHMQVQATREVGSPTVPFRLANYVVRNFGEAGEIWRASGVPEEGTILKMALRNAATFSILTSISPGTAIWNVEISGRIPARFRGASNNVIERIDVALDEAGRHVFRDTTGNYVVMSIDYDALRVVESRPGRSAVLQLLALSCVSVPHAAVTGMRWSEPALVLPDGPLGWLQMAAAPYQGKDFIRARNICICAPSADSKALHVETTLNRSPLDYPQKISSQHELLRGPVRFDAEFASGRLTLSLQSFAPKFSIHRYESEQA